MPGYGERRTGRAESHPRARGEKLCAQRRTRYSTRPGPLRPCASDFSRDLQGRTRSAADGASQVTGKVGVPLHQGLCGAARRFLALAPGGSPQDGGPRRERLSHGEKRAGRGCSRAEAGGGRPEPAEGDPWGRSDSQGLPGAGAPEMLELRSQQLEGREDVNASWSPWATGMTGLSLSIQGSCK